MTNLSRSEAFRQVMRRVPSPVTVVTAATPVEMRGITIGSFTSVSLNPPLISFNVSHKSRMHAVLLEVERFAVHLLRAEQVYLSQRFAEAGLRGSEQFAGLAYRLDGYGTPILEGVLAVLLCRPYSKLEAGDHTIFVGEVCEIETSEDGSPVLYYNRAYRAIGETLAPGPVIDHEVPSP
jgi:3-hydroxy-9,10-secoandrosta-1,3,5(10)-triene-9,17-dione monooxygenase reductase component